ncbi:hypothetical protein Tco_0987516 [Tanacetum coccineum]
MGRSWRRTTYRDRDSDHVILRVSPWKGMVRFGKKGKLPLRFVGPFEITERIDPVAYRLRPEELNEVLAVDARSTRNPIRHEYGLPSPDRCVRCAPFEALYGTKCRSLILWAEVRERQLIGLEIVQETTEKILQIKDTLKATQCRPWKGVVRFGKKGKLAPRFVGPFKITERIGPVAYRLRLLEELNGVHDTFHVSNLKKCLADPSLHIPLEEIHVDAKLNFMEEPLEILEREIKKINVIF